MAIHGSRADGEYRIEGMRDHALSGTGAFRGIFVNPNAVQEIVAETGGQSAETETGGVSVNVVLREGGNTFRGMAESEYTGKGLQSDNITGALRARGITTGNTVDFIYSAGAGIGGPIRRDRVWFYTAFQSRERKEVQAGIYYNKPELQHTLRYEPDLSHLGDNHSWMRDSTTRLTWQAAPKHRVSGIAMIQARCGCRALPTPARAPENVATNKGFHLLPQANWSHAPTNKLLFEAGFVARIAHTDNRPQPEVSPSDIAVLELSTGINYGPSVQGYSRGVLPQYSTISAASYITGSHALKVGLQTLWGHAESNPYVVNNDFPVQYQLRNGIPVSLVQVIYPLRFDTSRVLKK